VRTQERIRQVLQKRKPTSLPPPVKHEVPRICPGGTVVCLASGPSLKEEDVEYVRWRATAIIAVNDTYRLAPFATALMASDAAWWMTHRKDVESFAGLKYCLEQSAARVEGVKVLRNTGLEGIETDPTGLRTGRNSGAAAINLAVLFGASRIVILGYDMQAPRGDRHSHFFGQHPFPLRRSSNYLLFRQYFDKMVGPLAKLQVEVINCSRDTALTAFPRAALRDVLQ
jgi:hypothetical protein